jgi:hypothetical protein
MAYATDAHVHGVRATFAYNAADVVAIRSHTGDPRVGIHLIGGLSNAMGTRETSGFMRAVAACAPLGYSLYAFPGTRSSAWTALAAPPPATTGACG